jgi:hypothetical protein
MRVARPTSVAFVLTISVLLAGTLAVIGHRVEGLSAWIGMIPLVIVLLLVTFIPGLSLWLPSLVYR